MMEAEVTEILKDLGYGAGFDEASLQDWHKYSKVVSWVSNELKAVAVMKIDEIVNVIDGEAELHAFQIELSSLLKELGCVYSSIMRLDGKSRFDTKPKRLITLHFLLTELLSARISAVEKPKEKMNIQLDESDPARLLKEILIDIGLGTPPGNVTLHGIFFKLNDRATQVQQKLKDGGVELEPIFTGLLNDKQWKELKGLHDDFQLEYEIRRKMLLKRLDVTIESFHWSDRLANKKEVMTEIFRKHRDPMEETPAVKLSDVLAARVDLAVIDKTSSKGVRKHTKSAVNDVIIGKVPDRGGRPNETQAPPPEMPSWQNRQAGSVGWAPRGRGRGGGGDRGDRGGGGGRGGRGGTGNDYGGNRGGHRDEYGGNREIHRDEYGGGRGGYGNDYGGGRGGGSSHYGTNEGWHRGGGRGGYGNQDRDMDSGDQRNYNRGRRRGNNSRVQGGWAGNY